MQEILHAALALAQEQGAVKLWEGPGFEGRYRLVTPDASYSYSPEQVAAFLAGVAAGTKAMGARLSEVLAEVA